MKWLNLFIKFRLWIGLVLLALAIYVNIEASFWPSFIIYLIAVICILGHFLLGGKMRLAIEAMQIGDFISAQKIVDGIMFPSLFIRLYRCQYYYFSGKLELLNQNLEKGETLLKKALDIIGPYTKQLEGVIRLDLANLLIQKGDKKQGEANIRLAIKSGLPDNENNAAAYLQLCIIMMNKREFRSAKEYFKKAKSFKATTPQIVDQIKQIEKNITRMPG